MTHNEYATGEPQAPGRMNLIGQQHTDAVTDARLKEAEAWEAHDRAVDAWLYSAENQLIPADQERTRMLRRAMLDHRAKAEAAAEDVRMALEEEAYNLRGWGIENATEQELER